MAEKILGLYLLELKEKWIFGKNLNNEDRNWMCKIVKYIPDKGEQAVRREWAEDKKQTSRSIHRWWLMCIQRALIFTMSL